MKRQFYTITANDVGKVTVRCFGRTWSVNGGWGRTFYRDIGKRVYLIDNGAGGFLQIENDEQRDRRLGVAL